MTHHPWPFSQAYIAQATETGDFDQILARVAVISLYIVGLHRLAEQRYFFP